MSPEEDWTRDTVDSEPKHYQLSYCGPTWQCSERPMCFLPCLPCALTAVWTLVWVNRIPDSKGRMFLHSSLLQAIPAVMLWSVLVQSIPEAFQHLCLANLQISDFVVGVVDPPKPPAKGWTWLCASQGSPVQSVLFAAGSQSLSGWQRALCHPGRSVSVQCVIADLWKDRRHMHMHVCAHRHTFSQSY